METSVDRGWSWVVLAGVYFNCILTFGFIQCIGIFFIEWENDFGVSAQTVGWSSSFALAGFGMSGIITSVISACVSCRCQGFLAGMIVTISFSCAELITEVVHLYIVMMFAGFGIGMAFSNGIVVLGYYFHNRLAIANGLGLSGIGAGMFLIAPLLRYLNDEYSWKGAMTICGAILANICVCAALFRKSTAEALSMAGLVPEPDEIALKSVPSNLEGEQGEQNDGESARTDGYEHISELPSRPSKVRLYVGEEIGEDGEANEPKTEGVESNGKLPSRNSKVTLCVADDNEEGIDQNGTTRKTGGYENIDRAPPRNTSKSRLSVAGSSIRRHSTVFVRSYNVILTIRFAMMCAISPFLLGFAYFAALLYFASNAINLGISKTDAAFLISIIGIVGVVGRMCCGPILDKKLFTPFQFVSMMSGVAGISCLLGALARSYAWLVVFAVVLGLASSTCNVTYPLIIRVVVGAHNFKRIFGIAVLIWNVAPLIGLPLVGYVYDTTGDYAMAFYTAGSLFLLNTIVAILDPLWVSLDVKCKTRGVQQSENEHALEVK